MTDKWFCACCREEGWGQWYYSDYGSYQFFVCYGDCQDDEPMEQADRRLAGV